MAGQGLGHQSGQMRVENELSIRSGAIRVLAACCLAGVATARTAHTPAQNPRQQQPRQSWHPDRLSFTATTDGVAGAPDSIRIDLLRWSTDAERDQLMSAWNMAGRGSNGPGAAGRGAAGRGEAGAGGRGAARGDQVPQIRMLIEDLVGMIRLALRTQARAADEGRGGGGGEDGPPSANAGRHAGGGAPAGGYCRLPVVFRSGRICGSLRGQVDPAGWCGAHHPDHQQASRGYERFVETDWTRRAVNLRLFRDRAARERSKAGRGQISLVGKVAPDSVAKVVAPEDYSALPVVS